MIGSQILRSILVAHFWGSVAGAAAGCSKDSALDGAADDGAVRARFSGGRTAGVGEAMRLRPKSVSVSHSIGARSSSMAIHK